MRYIPFELLEEIPGKEDKFWSLICADDHFYKLTRAYNTISQTLMKAEEQGEADVAFGLQDLRKERLWIKDEIFYLLSH